MADRLTIPERSHVRPTFHRARLLVRAVNALPPTEFPHWDS